MQIKTEPEHAGAFLHFPFLNLSVNEKENTICRKCSLFVTLTLERQKISRMYGMSTSDMVFHDIPWVIERYGIVPEEVYQGLEYGSETHSHDEMEQMMKAMVEVLAKRPQGGKLTPNWKKAIAGVADAYLGDLPDDNMEDFKFTYNGQEYTPGSFSESLGWNMDDYISLTSYTHHPFYKPFVLEVQDNWAMRTGYNLPIDELMQVMEESVKNGYTFAWGAEFLRKILFRDALAILPEDESTIKEKGKDDKFFNSAGAEKVSNAFMAPGKERIVTQEERQAAFDSQETTDDHGMHITGTLQDQNGTKYFIVKNSWGTKYNNCDGYFYASFPYERYKTMNILIHKDGIPKDIKKK